MTADTAAYATMSEAATEQKASRLNWDGWVAGIATIVAESVLAGARAAA